MTTPPARIETLLSALAADAPYRDAILGDLAEEFTIRVEEQGTRQARRWYRRQALRSAPHLLRGWAMRLGIADVMRIVGWTFVSEATMQLVWLGIRAVIVASFGVVPDSVTIVNVAWRSLLMSEAVSGNAVYLAAAVSSMLVGYGIAHMHRRAPLGMCAVVGATASLILILPPLITAVSSVWLGISLASIVGPGMVLGGVLSVLRSAGRPHTLA